MIKINRLKELRIENGKTQADIAKYLNVAKQTVSNYELGTRDMPIETLKKLAEYFGVSTDYIIGLSNDKGIENVKFANSGGLDTTGLDKDEIEELKKQVEFMKWKKSNGTK